MADDQDDPNIQKAIAKINFHLAEAARWKRMVNDLDALNDRAPRFGDIEAGTGEFVLTGGASVGVKKWKPGEFFNTSLSGAVRRILEARRAQAGAPSPASIDEIHDALAQGSFDFDTNGAENQKNSIRISLGKNSATFVKLPNSELFGLAEWYGAKVKKPGRKGTETPAGAPSGEAAAGDTAAEVNAEQQMEGKE